MLAVRTGMAALLCASLGAAQVAAGPLDNMRALLPEPLLARGLAPEGGPVHTSVTDLALLRQLQADGAPVVPTFLGGDAQVFGQPQELLAARLGVGTEALAGVALTTALPLEYQLWSMAGANEAGAVIAHLVEGGGAAAGRKRVVLGIAGEIDMRARDPADPLRGMIGKAAILTAEDNRVLLARSEADLAAYHAIAKALTGAGAMGGGLDRETAMAVIAAVSGKAMLDGLDASLPADALVPELVFLNLMNQPGDPLAAPEAPTGEQTRLAPFIGLMVADWRLADGRAGIGLAMNFYNDCQGAKAAVELLQARWAALRLNDSGPALAEAAGAIDRAGMVRSMHPAFGSSCIAVITTAPMAPLRGGENTALMVLIRVLFSRQPGLFE